MGSPRIRLRVVFFGMAVAAGCAARTSSMATLARQLRGPDPAKRVAAANQAAQLGAQAEALLPALKEAFRDRRPAVHDAAGRAMSAMGEPGVEALASLLSDPDAWVRCRAAESLASLGPRAAKAAPQLVQALSDRDFCVTRQAALALGAVGEPAVELLLPLLNDPREPVRRGAAESLARMSPEIQRRVVASLLPGLRAKDELERGEAFARLTSLGPLGVPTLLIILEEKQADLRHRALDALGEIGDSRTEVVESLIRTLGDGDRAVRLKAAVILGRLGQSDPEVYKRVAPLLGGKDRRVVRGAMTALGHMGAAGEKAVPQLVWYMEEGPDEDLRSEALEALVRMGTTASVSAAEAHTLRRYRKSGSSRP